MPRPGNSPLYKPYINGKKAMKNRKTNILDMVFVTEKEQKNYDNYLNQWRFYCKKYGLEYSEKELHVIIVMKQLFRDIVFLNNPAESPHWVCFKNLLDDLNNLYIYVSATGIVLYDDADTFAELLAILKKSLLKYKKDVVKKFHKKLPAPKFLPEPGMFPDNPTAFKKNFKTYLDSCCFYVIHYSHYTY
jgi:phosphopantetheinyl transferase (holo-ACP synthase)